MIQKDLVLSKIQASHVVGRRDQFEIPQMELRKYLLTLAESESFYMITPKARGGILDNSLNVSNPVGLSCSSAAILAKKSTISLPSIPMWGGPTENVHDDLRKSNQEDYGYQG
ncbi:hypothetical protein TNCV_4107841 [Trichonephila clavipes]|nr:hypothetical protein TNCV_4107841 [Trichonephila clavipes]